MKKTITSKSTKSVNSTDIIIKSKDNRKVSTIDKIANDSVKGITTTKALAIIKNANAIIENKTKDKAKGFYAVKVREKNFKEWFEKNQDKEKKIESVKYNQASNLANMWHYVWCTKELKDYDSNKATALVAYVKKDYAKVVALHNSGKIAPAMSKADITETLQKEFGNKSKTVKEGTSVKAENDELKTALAMVGHFIKKNATKGGDIENAWNVILEYCER